MANYFPLESVLGGMFDLVQETFGLEFREVPDPDVWHPDVRLFAIHDAASGDELLTSTSISSSRGQVRARRRVPSDHEPAIGGRILPRTGVRHGRQLHQADRDRSFLAPARRGRDPLPRVRPCASPEPGGTELARFAGTSVEQDFVEAPSQIMQHWVWRRRPPSFRPAPRDGRPIPDQLVEQLVAAASSTCPSTSSVSSSTGGGIRRCTAPIPRSTSTSSCAKVRAWPHSLPRGTFALASFGHLMGGYDAAYYGYMWSEVFGDDMFSRFEDEGVTNPEVGMAYRREVLEKVDPWMQTRCSAPSSVVSPTTPPS